MSMKEAMTGDIKVNSLKSVEPSKSVRAGAGRMAKVVECLPSRCEVLSSNPSIEKIKEKNDTGICSPFLLSFLPSFFPSFLPPSLPSLLFFFLP
jgi:hypothetical protein